jgi:hypothetical protein
MCLQCCVSIDLLHALSTSRATERPTWLPHPRPYNQGMLVCRNLMEAWVALDESKGVQEVLREDGLGGIISQVHGAVAHAPRLTPVPRPLSRSRTSYEVPISACSFGGGGWCVHCFLGTFLAYRNRMPSLSRVIWTRQPNRNSSLWGLWLLCTRREGRRGHQGVIRAD